MTLSAASVRTTRPAPTDQAWVRALLMEIAASSLSKAERRQLMVYAARASRDAGQAERDRIGELVHQRLAAVGTTNPLPEAELDAWGALIENLLSPDSDDRKRTQELLVDSRL